MTPPAPRQYVVRRPSGDPGAVRRLAQAYDDLAAALESQARVAASLLQEALTSWRGAAAGALERPENVLRLDVAHIGSVLRRSAEDLRAYAHRLEKAHEHHGWSLGRLVAMGALVTVGAAAIVVTVGAAAPAEAAAATVAVEGAEAAAASAGAAGSSAASSLLASQSALAAVRPLAPFVIPHLVSAGASVGFDAVSELIAGRGLDLHSLEVAGAVGFAGSGAGGVVEGRLAAVGSGWKRVGEASTWTAAGTVGDYADRGSIDVVDSAAYGLTGSVARDVRAGSEEARLMWRLRVPQLPLGFASKRDWRRFVTTMYDGLDRAGYRDAIVAFRGSSVTGFSFEHGHPFDSDHLSDWDMALAHEGAFSKAVDQRLRIVQSEQRTHAITRNSHLDRMGLLALTTELTRSARRPVSWMIYKDLVAVSARGKDLIVVPRP